MKQAIIVALLAMFAACQPNIPADQPVAKVNTPPDTITTIELSTPVENDSIVIVLYPNKLVVRSTELTTAYSTEPFNTNISVNEQWGIERLTVNGTTLLNQQGSNHTYVYGEDPNTLIVQKGNTLSTIIADHARMGYDISLKELKKCNPFLSQRGLQTGDFLYLKCN